MPCLVHFGNNHRAVIEHLEGLQAFLYVAGLSGGRKRKVYLGNCPAGIQQLFHLR
jgi:hypothetical protein